MFLKQGEKKEKKSIAHVAILYYKNMKHLMFRKELWLEA